MTEIHQGGASLASYRFGGRVYPYRTVASCLTCNSPERLTIEQRIARGVPYRRIVEDLDLSDPRNRVTTRSLRSHFERGHMPVEAEAVRRIIDRRAIERGLDIEDSVQGLADGAVFAEAVLHKATEAISTGDLQPSIMDGLQAAKFLEDIRPAIEGGSESDYLLAFLTYHTIAQQIMTDSQFEEFGRRLSDNPVLRALIEQYSAEDEVVPDDEGDFYERGQTVVGALAEAPSEEDEGDED